MHALFHVYYLCNHSSKHADNVADFNVNRKRILHRADLNPSVAFCELGGAVKHLLLWEIELKLTLLARQNGGDNGLLASPRSCYTAGDTQAALYLAAVRSAL